MPKSRRRKRPQSRTPRRTAPLTRQARVLQETRALLDPSTSRHDAELWASQTLAKACPRKGLLGRAARDGWVRDLCGYAGRRRTREAAAFVVAVSTVLDDHGLAAAREEWADALLHDLPWTQERVGRPALITRAGDVWDDLQTWFLHYADHVLAIVTARSSPWHLVGLHLLEVDSPSRWDRLAQTDAHLLLPRTEVPFDQALSTLHVMNDVSARLLHWSSHGEVHPLGHLLTARLQGVVTATSDELDDEREELLEAFTEEMSVRDAWLVEDAFQHFLDFADTQMLGDPLAWSPALVQEFLLEWAPEAWDLDPEVLPTLPLATAVWVQWALRRRGLNADLAEATARVALAVSTSFRTICERELLERGYEPEDLPWQAGPAA